MKWIAYNIGDPQDNNCIKVENSTVTHTSINLTGKNNRIIVRNGAKMFFGGIKIIGNDNEVVYDGCKAMINVFMKGNGCKITVGKRLSDRREHKYSTNGTGQPCGNR